MRLAWGRGSLNNPPELIVVRGLSGAGKTTISREVQCRFAEGGVPIGLIEQDYYRETFIWIES